MKKVKILLILIGIFFISGCNKYDKVKVYNPLSEKEIISYVEEEIYNNYGDLTTAKIISKDVLKICTFGIDTCSFYQDVDGGHSYKIEITNKDNKEIIATATYNDAYIIYDERVANGRFKTDVYFENDYLKQKGLILVKNEFQDILNQKFSNYYMYKDVSNPEGYDIFINSEDYNLINDLLLSFKDITIKYNNYVFTDYSVYIYKDEEVFKSTDFDLYLNGTEDHGGQSYGKDMIEQYTGREVTRIGFSHQFDYDLFVSNGASSQEINSEYIDYNTFSYLVFWCSAGPNGNNLSFQIFGVK
ncbi:MAG: hypothetical protein IJ501_06985 [Bacilli bacterium]|nr:hypothetical protein [Bacilli bacterium]